MAKLVGELASGTHHRSLHRADEPARSCHPVPASALRRARQAEGTCRRWKCGRHGGLKGGLDRRGYAAIDTPVTSAIDVVSREVGVSMATLERAAERTP
jgi:hypothetical protein